MTEYGCLEFVTSSPVDRSDGGSGTDKNLIIGLVVGLILLVLIIILIIIIICVIRSRRKQKPISTTESYSNQGQSQYENISDASGRPGTGTTRSTFEFGNEYMSDKPVESVSLTQY